MHVALPSVAEHVVVPHMGNPYTSGVEETRHIAVLQLVFSVSLSEFPHAILNENTESPSCLIWSPSSSPAGLPVILVYGRDVTDDGAG